MRLELAVTGHADVCFYASQGRSFFESAASGDRNITSDANDIIRQRIKTVNNIEDYTNAVLNAVLTASEDDANTWLVDAAQALYVNQKIILWNDDSYYLKVGMQANMERLRREYNSRNPNKDLIWYMDAAKK